MRAMPSPREALNLDGKDRLLARAVGHDLLGQAFCESGVRLVAYVRNLLAAEPAAVVTGQSQVSHKPSVRVHSACAGTERQQPGHGKVCGRARRRALCARCSRLVSQVSLRASRHARTHEHLLHHTAWTACSPHVLAGRRKAVELTDNGYL